MFRASIAIVVALAITASAGHGEECPPGEPASPEVTTPATGVSVSDGTVGGEKPGIYYVDTELCQPGCAFSVWVYEETNGIEGLQPHDMWCDCTCHKPPSDTILF